MKAFILCCSFLFSFLQYAVAQQDFIYGGDIQDIEVVGKQKYDRLVSKGARMPIAEVSFEEGSKLKYLGSVVECSRYSAWYTTWSKSIFQSAKQRTEALYIVR